MGSFLQSFENAKYGSAAPHGELLVARQQGMCKTSFPGDETSSPGDGTRAIVAGLRLAAVGGARGRAYFSRRVYCLFKILITNRYSLSLTKCSK